MKVISLPETAFEVLTAANGTMTFAELYGKVAEIAEMSEEEKAKTGDMSAMDIYVGKNRNGKTGKVTLQFQKAYSRFDDPSPAYLEKQAALQAKYLADLDED